jgi:dTDP-4-dehydrorhamnose 3,5-epimerase
MRFSPTGLPGLTVVELEPHTDERGYFARILCERELGEAGLNTRWAQSSISFNARAGTLRGMHFQRAPFAETKIVRCARGAIYDVAVDLRPASPTYTRWFGLELMPDNHRMLYIPPGFGHGFVTLADASEVLYQISDYFEPSAASGVRWDDPAFAIVWPRAPEVINARDAGWPDFDRAAGAGAA